MQDYKVLSKGGYSARNQGPLNITRWLFVEKDGKKYLLLKFSKDSDKKFNRIRVKIDMLDKAGKNIGTVSAESESIPDGREFVFSERIEVYNNCSSFTAETQAADIRGYVYTNTTNGSFVDYAAEDNSKSSLNVEKLRREMGGKSVRVTERGLKAPVLICIFVCVLFVCAIFFTCLQLSAFKESQYDFLRSGVEYTFANGDKSDESALYVTGYRGNSPEAVIPERIENHPVTQISESAFSGNRKIKRLIIEGDTQINLRAFYCCPNLTYVNADSVTQIETEAFYGCERLEELSVNSAVTIGRRAFYGSGLTALKIPSGVNALSLGDYAFANCGNLKEICIDREIKYPKNGSVFDGATSLVSLSLKNMPEDSSLSSLLNSSGSALETVRIKNLSAIGTNFCRNFSHLKSFTVDNLDNMRIGDGAFYQCRTLEEINLPEGILSVGNSAFAGTAITSFDGNKLDCIGVYAFQDCKSLKTFALDGNTALRSFGGSAFSGCERLEKFTVPKDISELSDNLFKGCSSLENVVFLSDDTLAAIGVSVFENCSSLKVISLPYAVVKIGASAFRGCGSLTEIILPEKTTQIASYTFADCAGLERLYIPENVTVINSYAFRGCVSLLYFRADGSISSFGTGMLQGCTSLEELSVPLSVPLVNLFGGVVPESLKKVEVTRLSALPADAFSGCKHLRKVILNENLSRVGNAAFSDCYRLYEIYNLGRADISCDYALAIYDSLSDEMPKAEYGGYTVAYSERADEWYLIDYPENTAEQVLPTRFDNGAATDGYVIANYLFCETQITSVVIPATVGGIGAYSFYNCYSLERAEILSPVNVGISAFEKCTSLKSLSVPYGDGMAIGDRAFYGCTSLERAEILAYATIGVSAFENCVSLKNAYIYAGNGTLGDRAFYDCALLEKFVIPTGVVAIGTSAFSGCAKLNHLTLPSSLRAIHSDAFLNCGRLRAIVNYSPLTVIAGSQNNGGVALNAVAVAANSADASQLEYVENGNVQYLRYKTSWYAVWCTPNAREIKIDTFSYGGKRAEEIYISPNAFVREVNITSVVIGSAVKGIGESAFMYCGGISGLQLPVSGLTEIGEYAFYGCYSMTKVTVPEGIVNIAPNAFSNCQKLSEVNLPQTLRTIGDDAFMGCSSIVSIELPESLTQIGDGAFSGCYSLTEINFPEGLTYLGASAFISCAALKQARLPDRLGYISEYTFAYCSSLADVVLPAGLTAIGDNAFVGCFSLYQVHNLSGLSVRAGSDSYGKVAYYAFKVFKTESESLSFVTQDLCNFVLLDGTWYMYGYEGSYYRTAILPEKFTADGKTVSAYTLKSGTLKICRSAVIPVSVKKIEADALGADTVIYYCGTQSQWLAIRPQSLANAVVYFYTDKIDGQWQWTYDSNGNVTTVY